MGPTLTSFLSRLWRTSIERPMFSKDNEVEYFCIESGVWSKCDIVKAHSDLTYDLSFPSGMIIYAVSEVYLRLVIDAVKWNERLKVGNLVEKLNNKGYWTLCKIHHVHENGHLDLMILVSKSIETGVKPHCIRIRNEKGTPTTMLKEIEMKDVKAKQESAILESALRTCCMENVSCYDGPQPVSNFIQLGCHHFFHQGCLAPALRARIEKERVKSKPRPILCPSCETAKEVVECSCCNRVPHEITEQEVVGLVHSAECDFTAQDKEHWESVTLQVFLSGGRNAVVAQPNNTRNAAFALPFRGRAANPFVDLGFRRAPAGNQLMQQFDQHLLQRQQQNQQQQNGEFHQEEEKMITCVCGTPYFVSLRGRDVNCENPKCRRTMCVQCGELAHSGVSCARAKQQMEAQLRNPLLGFEASGIFLQSCPFCGAQGDRPRECFHITCSCGGQFCFLCAAPYSPIVSHSNAYHRRECAFFEQCCAKQCLEKGAPACDETASFLGPCTACKNTANHNQCTHSANWKACRKCAVTLKINCTHWCLECAKLGRLCSPPTNPIDPATGKLQFKIISRDRVVQAEAAEERKQQQVQWTPLKRGAEEVWEVDSSSLLHGEEGGDKLLAASSPTLSFKEPLQSPANSTRSGTSFSVFNPLRWNPVDSEKATGKRKGNEFESLYNIPQFLRDVQKTETNAKVSSDGRSSTAMTMPLSVQETANMKRIQNNTARFSEYRLQHKTLLCHPPRAELVLRLANDLQFKLDDVVDAVVNMNFSNVYAYIRLKRSDAIGVNSSLTEEDIIEWAPDRDAQLVALYVELISRGFDRREVLDAIAFDRCTSVEDAEDVLTDDMKARLQGPSASTPSLRNLSRVFNHFRSRDDSAPRITVTLRSVLAFSYEFEPKKYQVPDPDSLHVLGRSAIMRALAAEPLSLKAGDVCTQSTRELRALLQAELVANYERVKPPSTVTPAMIAVKAWTDQLFHS